MIEEINKKLIAFVKRAEKIESELLVQSFVNVGPLLSVLTAKDNQIIYGRRGTGKTHTLIYLSDYIIKKNNISIYIDMRNIGSSSSIYSDPKIPIQERAARLLIDTLNLFHDALIEESIKPDTDLDLSIVSPLLDNLSESISKISIIGTVEAIDEASKQYSNSTKTSDTFELTNKSFSYKDGEEENNSRTQADKSSKKRIGEETHIIKFGQVGSIMREIAKNINGKEIWLLLDEWSSIPMDLQPYLADLLRRTLFPIRNLVVKIAAIETRSKFRISISNDDYLGIELGADASVDLSLDDFMVFDNDEEQSIAFYKKIIFKHFTTLVNANDNVSFPTTEEKFVNLLFSSSDVFKEFVRATEGIPRDAFYILSMAAQKSFSSPFNMDVIRKASKNWYQRDKEAAASEVALKLLHWIIDEVIAHRKARAFLLERGVKHDLIDSLFDARLLHLLKKNVSARDTPGKRYDVYKIDYGCYVDLLSTAKTPQGLFQFDDETDEYAEVPLDDYRSIRRAILEIKEFENKQAYNEKLKSLLSLDNENS